MIAACSRTSALLEADGRQSAGVVGGCHGFAVGSGTSDGEDVTAANLGQIYAFGKTVGTLANRAHNIVKGLFAVGSGNIVYLMVGLVHCRSDQIIHSGVEYDEILD